MLNIQLLERAETELTDAYTWYDSQQPGLGERFMDEVDHYLNLIGANPYQYQARYGNELHVAPLKSFPYLLVYWVDQAQHTIFVTSVFHTSRKPKSF